MKPSNFARPNLRLIDLKIALQNIISLKYEWVITMSVGQWDIFLEEAYFRQDAVLIELDEFEIPINAYKLKEDDT